MHREKLANVASPRWHAKKSSIEVERRSRLDFFWQLPDTEEDALEAAKDLAWAQGWVN
jgi:hypothetical protein